MLRRITAVLLLVGLGVFAVPVRAAETPAEWKYIPADSLVVLRISSVDGFSNGFLQLLIAMDRADEAAVAEFRRGLIRLVELGRTGGVDTRSAIYTIVTPPTGRQATAFLVRAKDQDALRRDILRIDNDQELKVEKPADDGGFAKVTSPGSGHEAYFAHRGEWTLYTQHEAVMKLLGAAEGNLADSIEERAAELLAAEGGSVYVNVAGLRSFYADKIDEARDRIITGIEGNSEQLRQQGVGAAGLVELAKIGFAALGDIEWFAGNVELGNAGVAAVGELNVAEGSATAKFLAENKPAALDHLGLLPKDHLAYFGAQFGPAMVKAWTDLAPKLAVNDDVETRQILAESVELYAKAGLTSLAGAFSLPADGNSGVLQDVVYQCQDASGMRKALQLYAEGQGEVKTPLFTQRFTYKADAETYQERPVDLLTQSFEFADTDDIGATFGQAMMKRMFGGEKLEMRLTIVENLAILATGNDPKYLRELLAAMESGEGVAGLEKAYTDTRDRLDGETNLIVMLDLPQLAVDFFHNLKQVPELAPVLTALPFNLGVEPAASYGGLSVTTLPLGLRAKVFVPVAQPQGMISIFAR